MNIQVRTLAEFVADNGYDVKVRSTGQCTMFNIFHRMSDRESAFGFDQHNTTETVERIAMEYCTDEQITVLLENAY